MKSIELTKGKFTIVDDNDHEVLIKYFGEYAKLNEVE